MLNKLLLCSLCLIAMLCVNAQKKMLGYPFQFEKSFLAKGEYDTYFLDNPFDSAFALILKDNKKVEYIRLSKDFKVLDKISSPIEKTVLDQSTHKYIGGTANGTEYHFIYYTKSGYVMETVDFNAKSVSNKKILEVPSSEKVIRAFSDYNLFHVVATDDKAGQLVLYNANAAGEFSRKALPMATPGKEDSKNRARLSEFIGNIKVIKASEEPELSSAVQGAKLYSRAGDMRITINSSDYPTHIFTISLPDYTISEKTVGYESLVSKDDKGKTYISSYLQDDLLFSLILNKKSIRIAVQEISTGNILKKYDFTEDAGDNQFAETPVTERRVGKAATAKDVDDIRKVIKALTNGTEGIMVNRTDAGKLVVTAGTYDMIQMSSGGGGPTYHGGFQSLGTSASNGMPMTVWNSTMYMQPGHSAYTSYSARYYTSTSFKMLLDPATLKTVRGRVPRPVSDKIKDYIDDTDNKAKATNQFAIGKNQYYGYYDRDMQEYVIEQIRLYN